MHPNTPRRIALGATLAILATAIMGTLGGAQAQTAAPAASTAEQLVNSLEGVFGARPGFRRSHARGFCAAGEFIANGNATPFTTAATLQANARSSVLARFSHGGGNPASPDNAPAVRGVALSLTGPGDTAHEFVMINTPVFAARTPESFVAFLRVRALNPTTRQQNAAAIAAANAANPDWAPQIAYLRDTPPPASYATAPYFGVNSFVFINAAGQRRHARWTFEPVAGRIGLNAEQRAALGPDFLEPELRARVAKAPAEWRALLQFPREGDALIDAVTAWPADRETIEVGRLRITSVAMAGGSGLCVPMLFNPTLLPTGIEPSEDPILNIHAKAYAVSLSRRAP